MPNAMARRTTFAATAVGKSFCPRRYADGEIDRETYERMLDDLRK
jgi:uncharacterized membrane protein